ncbi:MAG: GntR family transcriptional regulator [Eubacteriales bacterium]
MIQIDPRSRTPIYEQLVDGITKLVVSGAMEADGVVPSVRSLAAELSINPNTVQKAFTELERRGILYSAPGKGRFVSGDLAALRDKQAEKQLEVLAAEIKKAVSMGVSRERIIALAEEIAGGKADD